MSQRAKIVDFAMVTTCHEHPSQPHRDEMPGMQTCRQTRETLHSHHTPYERLTALTATK